MTAKLLPCPFCGGTALQTSSNGIESCFLGCGCGAEGPACFSYVEALEAWNRRTQPPADEGEREIIATYKALHANKLGAHWLWVVIEQIAAGVPEDEAFKSFGYYETSPWRSPSAANEGMT